MALSSIVFGTAMLMSLLERESGDCVRPTLTLPE